MRSTWEADASEQSVGTVCRTSDISDQDALLPFSLFSGKGRFEVEMPSVVRNVRVESSSRLVTRSEFLAFFLNVSRHAHTFVLREPKNPYSPRNEVDFSSRENTLSNKIAEIYGPEA